ncbi:MAG: hypothetical protein OXD44_11580 [Gammaproteobacteria bacterium]|nr:hypothetical protein [Gammaproteobacteria bacterium]
MIDHLKNNDLYACLKTVPYENRPLHKKIWIAMKQNNTIIRKKRRQILQNSNNLDLKSYHAHKQLEETLKKAGIERPDKGPKIIEPNQVRNMIYR